MLCIINGAMAGLSGGALGYVFGFGESRNIKDRKSTCVSVYVASANGSNVLMGNHGS